MVVVRHASLDRAILAITVAAVLLLIANRWPREAAVLTLLLLPFLALFRRLLIGAAGWSSYDPLLLVAPIIVVFLILRLFVFGKRPVAGDRLSALIIAFLAVVVLQVVNPVGGSVVANLAGLLFVGVPVLWYFIGREYANRRTMISLVAGVIVIATSVGVYGLLQTQVGMPHWDQSWIDVNGFASLTVGGRIRAFGTFSNSAEYSLFLGVALVACVCLVLHRRPVAVLALPCVAVALFFSSVRGTVVVTFLAIAVVVGLRSRNRIVALLIVVVSVAGAYVALTKLGAGLQQTASQSSNPLVTHQIGGLISPLDPTQSTLLVHLNEAGSGFFHALSHPLGAGTGATTLAGQRFQSGAPSQSTEVDIADAFVGLGLLGGLLFVAVLVTTFTVLIQRYFESGDVAVLVTLGLAIVTLGQWLNGGLYAVAPLLWFAIGWATRPAGIPTHQIPAVPAGRSRAAPDPWWQRPLLPLLPVGPSDPTPHPSSGSWPTGGGTRGARPQNGEDGSGWHKASDVSDVGSTSDREALAAASEPGFARATVFERPSPRFTQGVRSRRERLLTLGSIMLVGVVVAGALGVVTARITEKHGAVIRETSPSARAIYVTRLNRIIGRLNRIRSSTDRQLKRAHDPGLQARAASQLERAHDVAAATAMALPAGRATRANAALVSALRTAASGYAALSRAVKDKRAAAERSAISSLRLADTRLRLALARVRRLSQ